MGYCCGAQHKDGHYDSNVVVYSTKASGAMGMAWADWPDQLQWVSVYQDE